jgi:hypothetical protein
MPRLYENGPKWADVVSTVLGMNKYTVICRHCNFVWYNKSLVRLRLYMKTCKQLPAERHELYRRRTELLIS